MHIMYNLCLCVYYIKSTMCTNEKDIRVYIYIYMFAFFPTKHPCRPHKV